MDSANNRYNLLFDVHETINVEQEFELDFIAEDVGPGHVDFPLAFSHTWNETFHVCVDFTLALEMTADSGAAIEVKFDLPLVFGQSTPLNTSGDDCLPDNLHEDGFNYPRGDDQTDDTYNLSMEASITTQEHFDVNFDLALTFGDLSEGGTPEAGTGGASSGLFAQAGLGNFDPASCPSRVFFGDAGFVNSNNVPREVFELFENTNWTGTTVELKTPNFGDRVDLTVEKVQRETIHRDFISYRPADWGSSRRIRYTFSRIDAATKTAFESFIDLTLGTPIGIIDHNTRAWNAIIVEPEAPISVESDKTDCKYIVQLELLWIP